MADRVLQASAEGDHASLQKLVKSGIKVNICDKDGKTPLHLASENNHENCVSFVIKKRCEINANENTNGKTALILSSEKIKTLIENKADLNYVDNAGRSALHWAVTNNNLNIVWYLLEKKANLELKENCEGFTALIQAADLGLTPIVELLLLNGACINLRDKRGRTALWFACCKNDLPTVRVLLKYKPDVNIAEDKQHVTPLNYACFAGHYNIVQELLQYGCDIETCGIEGGTPLFVSSQQGHTNIMSLLLEKGVNINAVANNSLTPLLSAAKNGHSNVITVLLQNGANINHCTVDNISSLYLASQNGHNEAVSVLLASGADVESKSNTGRTPIFIACEKNHPDIVKILLNAGANIECTLEYCGRTPLIIACEKNHPDIVKILFDVGANIESKTNTGRTPLIIACGQNHPDVIKMLLDASADIESSSNRGHTALIIACQKNNLCVVKMLLEAGANVDACTDGEDSSLHFAAFHGFEELVELLVLRKAKMFKDINGKTPLDIAVEKNFKKIVSVLKTYLGKLPTTHQAKLSVRQVAIDPTIQPATKDKPAATHTATGPATKDKPSSTVTAIRPATKDKPAATLTATQPTTLEHKPSNNETASFEGSSTPDSACADNKNFRIVQKSDIYEITRLVSHVMKKIDNRNSVVSPGPCEEADVDVTTDPPGIPVGASGGEADKESTVPKVTRLENDLSDKHLLRIAKKVGDDWEFVAGFLGVEMSTIREITTEYKSRPSMYAGWNMLIHWRDGATGSVGDKRGILREAMEEADRTDIVDMI